MRIHVLSDLHNEIDSFVPRVHDADVVILAGDIDVKARGVEWARSAFTCPVLYVPGNHELYSGHLTRTLMKMLDAAYANRWEDLMGDGVPLWVHGHSHLAVDYEIAGTRVVSNPRGYPGETTGFNETLVIHVP